MSSLKKDQMSSTEDALKLAFAETRGVSLVFSDKIRNRRVALRKSLSTSFEIAVTKLFLQNAMNFPKNAVHLSSVKDPAEWLKTNMDLAAQTEESWKASSAAAIELLMDIYEPTSLNFPAAAKRVANAVVASMKTRPRSLDWLLTNIPRWESRANLFKHDEQESEIIEDALRDVRLASYKDFFKTARGLGKRKLTLFVGPTNSGKTYQALNEMAKHESGVYLAPLRLLALEGQEELAKRGKPASILTGEERGIVPGSQFTASTIEMVNLQKIVNCALIDEVQNLADEDRGWAWTQALVGAPARHVLMTGSPDCVELVQVPSSYLGEELEIVRLERKNPLKALRHAVELDGKIDPPVRPSLLLHAGMFLESGMFWNRGGSQHPSSTELSARRFGATRGSAFERELLLFLLPPMPSEWGSTFRSKRFCSTRLRNGTGKNKGCSPIAIFNRSRGGPAGTGCRKSGLSGLCMGPIPSLYGRCFTGRMALCPKSLAYALPSSIWRLSGSCLLTGH
jgi:hypothetical protein